MVEIEHGKYMIDTDYKKYVVTKPLYKALPGIKNRQSPAMTYISNAQVPDVNYNLQLGWIYGIPEPNPHIHEHVHDYDELILYLGTDSHAPQVLGGEIEFYIGGQQIVFNTTSGIYIPAGTPHGPLSWKKFQSPHIEMVLTLGNGNPEKDLEKSGIFTPKKRLPKKVFDFDYEQYIIRSPLREIGNVLQKGRMNPSLTYMSRNQINVANCYLEYGWAFDNVEPNIGEMVHKSYEELVLCIGGDPNNPEDLGADMEFGVGGELMPFSNTAVAFVPKGIRHGPLNWKQVRKPYIMMALMLGAGSMAEAWSR